jgi:leucyl aminopeptidase
VFDNTIADLRMIKVEVSAEAVPGANISVLPAPEKPGLGLAGNEAGDISTVDRPFGKEILLSAGPLPKLNLESLRRAGGALAGWLVKNEIQSANLLASDLEAFNQPGALDAVLEGLYLGAFQFSRYKTEEKKKNQPIITVITASGTEGMKDRIRRIEAECTGVNLARDWAHEPANIINPVSLAYRIQELFAGSPVKVHIIEEEQLKHMGAGAILAVGLGSQTPPRLIVLEYSGTDAAQEPVVLVGKALTFDSGGYSIKSTESIQGMKYDKCGGTTVVGTIFAAAALELKINLVGLVSAAENMISAHAYRPDDIITSMSGKTIEIITTDAEGRLVLADALTYSQVHYHPRALVDLATLTGGVVVALGKVRAGLMANNDELANRLAASGDQVYERLWRLPLDDEYAKNIKGDDADLKNSGGREGHAIMGGIFLKQFIADEIPWAHLDIAGVADSTKAGPYCPKGATGFGVRLLINYLQNL